MEKSPTSGIPSSLPTPKPADSALEALNALASHHLVASIALSLGADADLHIVGGTVRDLLEEKTGGDIDLAAALPAQELLRRLESDGFRVIATGIQHGTVTCVVEGRNIEITAFRAGRGAPATSILDDLAGRDFTMNAVAFSVDAREFIDPFGGLEDLRTGTVRSVGNAAERFGEDPLRILRMIRFGPASGRSIEPETAREGARLAPRLAAVSVERIRSELEKILMGSMPAEGVRSLERHGLLPFTWPELIPTVGFEQNRFHIHDVFEHTLEVLRQCPADRILRLAAVYHDIGKAHTLSVDAEGNRHFYEHEKVSAEICRKSMERLRFSNDDITAVSTIVRLHMRPFDCGPAGVRRLLRDLGPEFARWRAFKNADRPGVFDDALLEQLKERFDSMVDAERNRKTGSVYGKLAVTGDDLIALGVKPGRFLGGILRDLQNAVIENPDLNERDALLTRAKEILRERAPE